MNPPPDRQDGDPMLDLPLRSGEQQAELPLGPDRLRPDKSGPPPVPPSRRRPPRVAPKRGRILGILGAAVVLLVVAYLVFWPKPPEAAFSADPFVVEKVRVGETGELQSVTVNNAGERPMPIQMLGLPADSSGEFQIEEDGCGNQILGPLASCTVQIRFTPAEMGQRQTTLELHAEMPKSPARLAIAGEGTAPLMVIRPADARFGARDVGVMSEPVDLVVGNEGTAPLKIQRVAMGGTAERDFRLTRNECSKAILSPGETCALRLVFLPRAAGVRAAELILESDALRPQPVVKVSGEGIWTGAAFAVEPRAVEFGRHLVGMQPLTKSIQVINRQGTALSSLRVGLSETDRGFSIGKQSCSGQTLAPGESCRIEVIFSAKSEGEFGALLEISQQDAGMLGIELGGRGAAPRWVLERSLLEFDDVRVGTSSEARQIVLRNEGSAGSKANKVELVGGDPEGFKISGDRCTGTVVEPESRCALEVLFQPQREGDHGAEVRLQMAAGESPQKIELTARAIAPRLSLDREMVDFSRVHRTTRSQIELRIANRGTDRLALGPFSIEDDPNGDFQILGGACRGSNTLPAGGRCGLVIAFSPRDEGRITAQLRIEHDGISGPRELMLAGIGLPPPIPKLILEPASLDFGPQPVGNRSTIQTVNIGSGGTGNLDLREFQVEGSNAGDFRIVPATCQAGPSLQPGTSCTVGVRFTPSEPGARSAILVLRHNAGSGRDSVELRGKGLGGPPSR